MTMILSPQFDIAKLASIFSDRPILVENTKYCYWYGNIYCKHSVFSILSFILTNKAIGTASMLSAIQLDKDAIVELYGKDVVYPVSTTIHDVFANKFAGSAPYKEWSNDPVLLFEYFWR